MKTLTELFLAMEVGCLECAESTEIIGVYRSIQDAADALAVRLTKNRQYTRAIEPVLKNEGRFQIHQIRVFND